MGSFQFGSLVERVAITATAVGNTTLTNVSPQNQVFTGSSTQTVVLPNATTMTVGQFFNIYNQSSGALTLQFNGGSAFTDASGTSYSNLAAHSYITVLLQTNGTSAGTWSVQTGSSTSSAGTKNYLTAIQTSNGTNTGNGNFELGATTGWSLAHSALSGTTPTTVATATNAFSSAGGVHGGSSATALQTAVVSSFTSSGITATWSSGNAYITVSSTTGIVVGQIVTNPGSGTGWPTGTVFVESISGTSVYLNTVVTGTQSSASSVTFNSAPLEGSYSIAMLSSGVTGSIGSTAGDMLISNAFYVDNEDQAKVLTVKFYYQNQSGSSLNFSGTSSNGLALWIYDVTNAAWIQPAGVYNLTQSSGIGYCTATFQTTTNSTQYQLALINVNATANSYNIWLDSFFVGPQTAPSGPAMTDWVAYTPTFTGYGTVSSVSFQSRRVGDSLQVHGSFIAGTTTATPNLISIGYNGGNSNVVVDTTKISGGGLVGTAGVSSSSTTTFGWNVLAPSSNASTVQLSIQNSTNSGVSGSNNGNAIASSTQTVEVQFMVPIVGWSSNTNMSSDTDTRVVAMRANTSTTAIGTSDTQLVFSAVEYDTHGAYSNTTGAYTVPVTGYYKVSSYVFYSTGVSSSSAGPTLQMKAYVNGVAKGLGQFLYQVAATQYPTMTGSTTVYAQAGQTIYVTLARSSSNISSFNLDNTATDNWLSIERVSGPAVVAATESVNCGYNSSAAQAISSGASQEVVFGTKLFDSHNAMNASTGTYTCPVAGKYLVTGVVTFSNSAWAAGQIVGSIINHNGSSVQEVDNSTGSTTAVTLAMPFNAVVSCVAGDTLSVNVFQNSGGSKNLDSNSNKQQIYIARVGN